MERRRGGEEDAVISSAVLFSLHREGSDGRVNGKGVTAKRKGERFINRPGPLGAPSRRGGEGGG